MTRVLLVADSLDVGGAEQHVVGLAMSLARCDHSVAIATSTTGSLVATAQEAGVPVWPLVGHLVKRRFSLRYALALQGVLRRGSFDVVHAHMYGSVVAAAAASTGTGVPLIVTEHSEAAWRGWRVRLISRFAYRRARTVIAVSQGIRRRLRDLDGVPPSRIELIPNALPPVTRQASSTSLPRRREGEVWIGVVGRLQPEKGVDDFLRAIARVADAVPHARFIIVGDGPDRSRLTTLVHQLGLAGRVTFLGFRTDVQAVLGQFDILVVPSRSEGTPLGLLVPAAQPDALGGAILTLVKDPALARRLAEAGRDRLRTAFDHDTMVRRTIEVYDSALSAAGRRTPTVPDSVSA